MRASRHSVSRSVRYHTAAAMASCPSLKMSAFTSTTSPTSRFTA